MHAFLDGLFSPTFNGADLWATAIAAWLILRMAFPPEPAENESTDE